MPLPIPSSSALSAPVVASINHVLAQEPWAQQQLALHAGKVACIDTGALALRLRVAGGMFEVAPEDAAADVTIRVKLSDLPLILQNRERAFSYVKIEGDAEFANAISQLSKTLRWEAEHDLEKLVGQIAAQRLASGARAAVAAARTGQQRLAENVAEFFLEEQPLLVRPAAVDAFSADVARLRDDVERVAKRMEKLEQKLARSASSAPSSPDTK
jgi:ubiquinone biosynthesis protein UbiJ